jgi:ABC-type antimicrobial peptide transport system permease subunit
MATPVLAGREFDERDTTTSPKVAVVNETFARYYFKGRSPLGKWISLEGPDRDRIMIAGVVKDMKYRDLRRDFPRTVYFASSQNNSNNAAGSYFVRAAHPGQMTRAIEARLRTIDPAFRVEEPLTMEEHVARSVLTERMLATLSGFFGALGLLVAAIGIYGVMAFQVARRRKEIGVRLAVGASPGQLVQMVLSETARLVVVAGAIGIAGALALTRLTEKMLFGIKPADPATFAMAIAAVTLAALAAAYLPGRKAARLNPVETLRCD